MIPKAHPSGCAFILTILRRYETIKTMLAFLAIWASLMGSASAQTTNSCVAVKSVVKALKSGSDPKVFEKIYPNEPLKVVATTKNKKHIKVKLGTDMYWVPAKDFEQLDPAKCSINMCVYLSADAYVHSRPNKKASTQIVDEGLFPVVSNAKSWYRVKTASGYIWMTGAQLKNSKADCSAPVDDEVIARASQGPPKKQGWLFGFEAGYIVNVSSEPLSNLLTPTPPAGADVNDDAYPSPFVDEVIDGSGWFAGATLEFPMFWNLRNKIAVGYKTRSLEYIQRPNPHNGSVSFITYDQLTPETVAYDFTFIYATTTIKYEGWELLGLQWQPGILVGFDYSLDDFQLEFRTAPQKLTPFLVSSGYQSFELLYGPRLDINLGLLTFGVTAVMTDYGMEPSLSVGVQF